MCLCQFDKTVTCDLLINAYPIFMTFIWNLLHKWQSTLSVNNCFIKGQILIWVKQVLYNFLFFWIRLILKRFSSALWLVWSTSHRIQINQSPIKVYVSVIVIFYTKVISCLERVFLYDKLRYMINRLDISKQDKFWRAQWKGFLKNHFLYRSIHTLIVDYSLLLLFLVKLIQFLILLSHLQYQ